MFGRRPGRKADDHRLAALENFAACAHLSMPLI
jgi:hypothetical protein